MVSLADDEIGRNMSALELKIPPVLVSVLFAALMWLLATITPGVPILPILKKGLLVLFVGLAAWPGLSSVATFKKANTTVNPLNPDACSSLVVSGMYRHSRNPMYLALLLVLIGWGFYLANPFSLLAAGGFVIYMNRFQIQPEERALEKAFGEEFNNYRKRVRRWI